MNEADRATEAAKEAVQETTRSVDSWLQERRRIAAQNDVAEDEDRQRYIRERDEAMKDRERRVIAKLRAMNVSLDTIRRLLDTTPEEIE